MCKWTNWTIMFRKFLGYAEYFYVSLEVGSDKEISISCDRFFSFSLLFRIFRYVLPVLYNCFLSLEIFFSNTKKSRADFLVEEKKIPTPEQIPIFARTLKFSSFKIFFEREKTASSSFNQDHYQGTLLSSFYPHRCSRKKWFIGFKRKKKWNIWKNCFML